MTQNEFIEKWKLNKTFLAAKLGMSPMTFINRFKEPSPEDYQRLKDLLLELRDDLGTVYGDTERRVLKDTLRELLEQVDADGDKYGPEVVDQILKRIREQNGKT